MEQKLQTLNNLYALRAGLSVISQQYENAQAIEDDYGGKLAKQMKSFCGGINCDENYQELDKLKAKYSRNESRTTVNNVSVADMAYGHWLALEESTEYFKKNRLHAEYAKQDAFFGKDTNTEGYSYKKNYIRKTALSVIFFIIMAVTLILPCAIAFGACGKFELGILMFFFAVPAVFLILGIVFACSAKSNRSNHLHKLNEKDAAQRKAEALLKALPAIRENSKKLIKEKDGKIAKIIEISNDIYFALKKQFSQILDERDWKNLDLVIYELETRRADSIKEALHLVDRELQTERIQNTIVKATEQICYEIRRSFSELQSTIIEYGRIISAQLNAISLQLGEMNEQLSDLCDGVAMSNALQAKAAVTSAQLVDEVYAIRYYK